MKEPDSLDALLREWKSPDPSTDLDQRVVAGYRSAVRPRSVWAHFWTMRFSVPAPAVVLAMVAILALFLWMRPSASPTAKHDAPDAVTQLNASGFQPLPDGEARIIPATEIQK